MTISLLSPTPDAEKRRNMFDTLVAPRIPSIRRLVKGLTLPREDVDDNLQDVLIRLFQVIDRYDPASPFTPWLDAVVRRYMLNVHQHHATPTAMLLDYTDDDASLDSSPAQSDPALPFAFADDWRPDLPVPPLTVSRDDYPRTYDALQRLSPLQRRALLLVSEGWSPAEVARELRLSPANVRQIIHRARTTMAAALADKQCAAL